VLYTAGQKRQKRPKFGSLIVIQGRKIYENLSFQPNQPGGKFFWVTKKLLAEKIHSRLFFFFLHSIVIVNVTLVTNKINITVIPSIQQKPTHSHKS